MLGIVNLQTRLPDVSALDGPPTSLPKSITLTAWPQGTGQHNCARCITRGTLTCPPVDAVEEAEILRTNNVLRSDLCHHYAVS